MATSTNGKVPAENPYGGIPGGGITLPPYYKPTDSVHNTTIFFPTAEELGEDEMRISFVGSCPWPPRHSQAGTSIMVELGNGKRFFFDLGSGCLRNIIALQVPPAQINDIFIAPCTSTTMPTCPTSICSRPPWGRAGSRCGLLVRRAGLPRTAPST